MADSEKPLYDDYDSPWKEALVGYLPEFFAFFFPDIGSDIDWSKAPVFLDKELRQMEREAHLRKREADALVKVYRYDGEETWVLIHIEVQAQWEPQLPLRMFVSFYRIFDLFHKPVCSLAILADSNSQWQPDSYSQELWGTRVSLDFRVAKLKRYDTPSLLVELGQSPNPFAHLVAATLYAQSSRPDSKKRARNKFQLVRSLLLLGLQKKQVQQFFRLIDWVLVLSPPLEQVFRTQLQQLEKESKVPYITSIERLAREEGREEGLEQVAQRMLSLGLSPELIQQSTGLSYEAIESLSRDLPAS